MKKKILLTLALCSAVTFSLHGETLLSILNPGTSGSSITISPGATFTAEVFVSNLSTPLDGFDLQLNSLPTGITLMGFSDEIPSGWIPLSNVAQQQYGASNFAGSDISSSGELVQATFQTTSLLGSGPYTLSFIAPSLNQELHDASLNNILYTEDDLTVNVTPTAAPEPSTWALLLGGVVSLFVLARRRAHE